MFNAKFKAAAGLTKIAGATLGGGVALDIGSMVNRFQEVVKSEEEFRLGMKDIIFSTTEISAQTDKLQDSYLKLDDIVNRTGHSRQVALKIQTQEMQKGFTITKKTFLSEKERLEQTKDFQSSMSSSLSMSKQLGINAEESADYIGRMRREMGWSAVQSTQLVRDMKAVSESSGLFGAHLLDALKRSDAIVKSLRNSGNLTNRNLKNVTTVMASASKFGVDDVAEPLLRATSSLKEWIAAAPETKSALAQMFGMDPKEMQQVIMGGYGKGKEGYKSMGEKLDTRATDLLQQTFSAGARELNAAGATFNQATGTLKTKGGKEIKVTLENFDALMQAVPELAQVANQNILSSLKMEAGQAKNLALAIKESTMSTEDKIKTIQKEIDENNKLGASTESLTNRIKDLKINDFLSNVTDLSEGMKAGSFDDALKNAFGGRQGLQKGMAEGFEPFMAKAKEKLGEKTVKGIADQDQLKKMIMSGDQSQIELASKKLGEISEMMAKEDKVRSDPMYRIEDALKRIEQIIGSWGSSILGNTWAKMAVWGVQLGAMVISLGLIARNTAMLISLMRGKMPGSTLGAFGIDPKSSKALMSTEKFITKLWYASQSNHSLHVSLNEFSARSLTQLRTMKGGFSLGKRGGLADEGTGRDRRRAMLEERRAARGGGVVKGRGGLAGRIGSGALNFAADWGPELLTGYLMSKMMPTGEEGEGSFLGDIAKQGAGMAAGMGVAMLARKALGKGIMGNVIGSVLGDTAMGMTPDATGGLMDTAFDIWSMKDALTGTKAAATTTTTEKGVGMFSKVAGKFEKATSFFTKGSTTMFSKVVPKMTTFSTIGSKIMPMFSTTSKFLSKAAGPLSLAVGGISGIMGAGKEGMSSLEGGILGMLTGGAERGSSLSSTLGVTKGSNTDELLGAYGSMAYGATTGAMFGGPVGAAAGAGIAAGAELYKVVRSANMVVEDLKKEVASTSVRQEKFNTEALTNIQNISSGEEKLKELKATLESARNKLQGNKSQVGTEAASLSENSGLMSYIPGMKSGYNAAKTSYEAALADLKSQEIFVAQLEQQSKTLEDSLAAATKEKELAEQAKKEVSPQNLGAFDKMAPKDALAEGINTALTEKGIGATENPVSKIVTVLTEIKDIVSSFKPKEVSEALSNSLTQIQNEQTKIASMQNLGLFENIKSSEALNPNYSVANSMVEAMGGITSNATGGKTSILNKIFNPIENIKGIISSANKALGFSDSSVIDNLIASETAGNENITSSIFTNLVSGGLGGRLGSVRTKNLPGIDLEESIQREREATGGKSTTMVASLETLNDYFLNIQKGLLTEIKDHLAKIETVLTPTGSKQVGNSVFSSKVDLKSLPMVAHSPDFAEYGYSQAEGGVSKNPSIGAS
jgi:exonuclease VII small subunit